MDENKTDNLLRVGDYVVTSDNCLVVCNILENGIVECVDLGGRIERLEVKDARKVC